MKAIIPVLLALTSANGSDFEPQLIDDKVEIGYGLSIGDVDSDGKPDILLADKREIRWYSNPDWRRHTIAKNLTLRDNVCIASIPSNEGLQVAVGAQWNPGESSDRSASGAVFYLSPPDDRTKKWTPVPLPHDPTTHRMHWLDSKTLAVLPLHGMGGASVRLGIYVRPDNAADTAAWKTSFYDTGLTKTHNFDKTDDGVTIGGAEGLYHYPAKRLERQPKGIGELRQAADLLAAISPMHGNEVIVRQGEEWKSIDESLNQGHGLAIGDLLGLGTPQIVAGWRNPDKDGRVGIRLYSRDGTGDGWSSVLIDDNKMACEDLKLADLDSDGDLDIIASGRNTHNLIIYWNKR